MISFDNFNIIGDDGISYSGVRPGSIPKPFRKITIHLKNGKVLIPIASPDMNPDDIIGFDCAIKVMTDMTNQASGNLNQLYRIVTIYKDNSRFSVFFDYNSGEIRGSEWG